ncbi:MAG: hypothetical protein ACJA0Q_001031 [Saprospiraceae bacterium]|jgi:hypothetical protein
MTMGLVLCSFFAFSTAFSFRVQCTKKGDPNLLTVFNKIPDRQSYMLPSGTTLYFSGGYFKNLGIAQNRLEVVKNLGIDEAFIRVFMNKAYLSDRVSANMLDNLMKEYKENLAYDDSVSKVSPEIVELPKKKTYTREEFAALKRSKRIAKGGERGTGTNELVSKAASREEKKSIKESVKDFGDNFKVQEEPVFKILLSVTNGDVSLSSDFDLVNDIIYENNIGNKNYFTVGFFKDIEEAKSELSKYKMQLNKGDFKVVGMYRGSLISKELAVQLQEQYLQFKKGK